MGPGGHACLFSSQATKQHQAILLLVVMSSSKCVSSENILHAANQLIWRQIAFCRCKFCCCLLKQDRRCEICVCPFISKECALHPSHRRKARSACSRQENGRSNDSVSLSMMCQWSGYWIGVEQQAAWLSQRIA